MNEQELGEILKDLAIDMTNCNLLQRIEVAQAAKAKLLKWRDEAVRRARIDEVKNAYNLMQSLLFEHDDSDEVTGQFQVEARKRIAQLSNNQDKKGR